MGKKVMLKCTLGFWASSLLWQPGLKVQQMVNMLGNNKRVKLGLLVNIEGNLGNIDVKWGNIGERWGLLNYSLDQLDCTSGWC